MRHQAWGAHERLAARALPYGCHSAVPKVCLRVLRLLEVKSRFPNDNGPVFEGSAFSAFEELQQPSSIHSCSCPHAKCSPSALASSLRVCSLIST